MDVRTYCDQLQSIEDAKSLSKDEFIKLYEEIGSSRKFVRLVEGRLTRGFIDSYYKDCLHKPYSETRICIKCKNEYHHLVKSRRDSTKICKKCRSIVLSELNAKYIKNKPSHRRMSNKNPKIMEDLTPYLRNTFFTQAVPVLNDVYSVLLECICGKWVEQTIKNVRKSDYTNKKSCGCKNGIRQSRGEIELRDYIVSLVPDLIIKENTKPQFMQSLELDLYCPTEQFAVEYHGLAIHSERPVFGSKDLYRVKTQHQLKYFRAVKANIRLVQIFEDEWREKQEIVKSILANKLHKSKYTIFARKCIIKTINKEMEKTFLDKTHIAGYTRSKKAWGLYYENELVAVLSLRTPFTKKHNTIEIARFSSKLHTNVVGGFQKLLKQAEAWSINFGYSKLLSYADCRFGSGKVYEKAGFKYSNSTNPNYFYEKQGTREGRFKHRKNNNPRFIAQYGSTEREQNNNQGWYAIYDAGSEVYIKDLTAV